MTRGNVSSCTLALLTALLILLSPPVFAIKQGGVGAQPARSRHDEPRSKNIFIHDVLPGQIIEEAVSVFNMSDDTKTIAVNAVDSIISSSGGFACKQSGEEKKEVGGWITLEKELVALSKSDNEEIPFTITIPENTEPGEYNACIVFQEKKENTRSGLSLNTRIGIRVLLNINGDLKRELINPNFLLKPRKDGGHLVNLSVQNTSKISINTLVESTLRSLPLFLVNQQLGGEFPILRERDYDLNFDLKQPYWGGFYLLSNSFSYDSDGDGERDTTLNAGKSFLFFLPNAGAAVVYLVVLAFAIIMYIRTINIRKRKKKAEQKKKKQE